MVSHVVSRKMEGRSGCETMQKLRHWLAPVKMAMSESELLPLEGAINGIWRFLLLGERWPLCGKEYKDE